MSDNLLLLEEQLQADFNRWDELYRHGGNDPFYADGTNLNLVRNHILAKRRRMEEAEYFPEIYFREIPPVLDRDYMAKPEEIRRLAIKAFEMYQEDVNYNFLMRYAFSVPEGIAKEIALWAVLGYVQGLERALQEDDLVSMRRHSYPKRYLESFQHCRSRLEAFYG